MLYYIVKMYQIFFNEMLQTTQKLAKILYDITHLWVLTDWYERMGGKAMYVPDVDGRVFLAPASGLVTVSSSPVSGVDFVSSSSPAAGQYRPGWAGTGYLVVFYNKVKS